MKVKIAIIGSADFCQRTEQLINNKQDIELITYVYNHPKEAGQLVQSLHPCDVVLFSGSLPYHFAKSAIQHLPIPTLYLKQDERAIAITLLYVSTQLKMDLQHISIDVRNRVHIDYIMNDVNHEMALPHVYLLHKDVETDQVVEYHTELFKKQKTSIAITSIHAVYEKLKQNGIPALKMIDPTSSLLHTIERAKEKAILANTESSQIAVGIIKGSVPNDRLESFVSKLASFTQADWYETDGQYTLFTTVGKVDLLLQNEEFLEAFQMVSSDVKMAFGTGETQRDATANALAALDFANEESKQSFYILDKHKKLHGPYPQSTQKTIKMKIDEPTLVEIATNTKLSAANISKLMHFGKSRQAKQFTANDLALYLNVTRRTAERMIKKLVESDYIKVVGEEMTYKQGRPRALYELNFATYQ